VSGLPVGDRVADMTVLGSNAAHRTLRADRLIPCAASLDAAETATLILSWRPHTSSYTAQTGCSQRVLVQGAAGAVDPALLALGRLAGLKLWGTARGEHVTVIRALGATPIDHQREDFIRVLAGGFDVAFDGIGEDGYRR
jgi:NADPH:quinone reductase